MNDEKKVLRRIPGQKSAADYLREARERREAVEAAMSGILPMNSHMDQFTYKLDENHRPVQCANDDAWWLWYIREENRRVAKTELMIDDRHVTVSTVFTSLDVTPDHMLFETKIFGGEHDGEEERCATWEEAEAQHAKIIAALEAERK